MLSPKYPAAVIAGNTEVSQAVTDALFAALGILASSQGTMNNFLYGNAAYQNYETICGGPERVLIIRGPVPYTAT